jgi:hypothetical protein
MAALASVVDVVDGSSTGTRVPRLWELLRLPRFRGATHADDHDNLWTSPSLFSRFMELMVGQVVIRRQLKRRQVQPFFERLPPCPVGIEACASSHHWSRQLQALVGGLQLTGHAELPASSGVEVAYLRVEIRWANSSHRQPIQVPFG